MNVRQGMLLQIMLHIEHYTPIDIISAELGCSEKTVRLDMKVINDWLVDSGYTAHVEGKRGSGIRMVLPAGERSQLEAHLGVRDIQMRPRLDHFYRGMIMLMSSPKTLTADDLARELFANKQQITSDMKQWKSMLEPFGLSLEKRGRLDIAGNELAVRFFFLYHAYTLAGSSMKQTVEPEFLGEDAAFLRGILRSVETHLNCALSGNAARQLSFYMKIMVLRVRCGRVIPPRLDANEPLEPHFEAIRQRFEQRWPIHLPNDELHLLRDLFLCATWQWSTELIEQFQPSPATIDACGRLERALFERFGTWLDDRLRKPLSILMQNALIRRDRQLSIVGPDERIMKFDHMDRFLLFSELFCDVPELADIRLFSTDYSRISMLLLEYFEKANLQRQYRAGLVVKAGVEQVAYARYRIEQFVPMVRVDGVVTEAMATSTDAAVLAGIRRRFDFLITFDALACPSPSICMSEAIDDDDLSRLVASLSFLEESCVSHKLELVEEPATVFGKGAEKSIDVLYHQLKADGLLQLSAELFAFQFDANSLFMGSTLIVPLFNAGVVRTTARFYPAKQEFSILGRQLDSLALLLVAEEDRDVLVSLCAQFKQLLSQRVDLATTRSPFFEQD